MNKSDEESSDESVDSAASDKAQFAPALARGTPIADSSVASSSASPSPQSHRSVGVTAPVYPGGGRRFTVSEHSSTSSEGEDATTRAATGSETGMQRPGQRQVSTVARRPADDSDSSTGSDNDEAEPIRRGKGPSHDDEGGAQTHTLASASAVSEASSGSSQRLWQASMNAADDASSPESPISGPGVALDQSDEQLAFPDHENEIRGDHLRGDAEAPIGDGEVQHGPQDEFGDSLRSDSEFSHSPSRPDHERPPIEDSQCSLSPDFGDDPGGETERFRRCTAWRNVVEEVRHHSPRDASADVVDDDQNSQHECSEITDSQEAESTKESIPMTPNPPSAPVQEAQYLLENSPPGATDADAPFAQQFAAAVPGIAMASRQRVALASATASPRVFAAKQSHGSSAAATPRSRAESPASAGIANIHGPHYSEAASRNRMGGVVQIPAGTDFSPSSSAAADFVATSAGIDRSAGGVNCAALGLSGTTTPQLSSDKFSGASPEEIRRDPADGSSRTLGQMIEVCSGRYTPEEAAHYWYNACVPVEEEAHPRASSTPVGPAIDEPEDEEDEEDALWIDPSEIDLFQGLSPVSPPMAPAHEAEGAVSEELLDWHIWELRREHEGLLRVAHERGLVSQLNAHDELRMMRRRVRKLRRPLHRALALLDRGPQCATARANIELAESTTVVAEQRKRVLALAGNFRVLHASLSRLQPPLARGARGGRASSKRREAPPREHNELASAELSEAELQSLNERCAMATSALRELEREELDLQAHMAAQDDAVTRLEQRLREVRNETAALRGLPAKSDPSEPPDQSGFKAAAEELQRMLRPGTGPQAPPPTRGAPTAAPGSELGDGVACREFRQLQAEANALRDRCAASAAKCVEWRGGVPLENPLGARHSRAAAGA